MLKKKKKKKEQCAELLGEGKISWLYKGGGLIAPLISRWSL